MSTKSIFITGSTGVGKTKLSIQLARKLNGEVINMDAMQMNKPLDIVLNKASNDEISGVKHHLLSFLDVEKGISFDVNQFMVLSQEIVAKIQAESKVPILVGGTTYYMEAHLYHDFLSNQARESVRQNEIKTHMIHPNQLRKIRKENSVLNIAKPVNLRYPDSLVIWLDFDDREQLRRVLEIRIEKMMERGLVQELMDFVVSCAKIIDKLHVKIDQEPKDIYSLLLDKDETNEMQRRGILQCIGLKEFSAYLRLSSTEKQSKDGQKILKECQDRLLSSTFQYAVRQKRWMTNRFLKRENTGSLPIFRISVDEVFKIMLHERHMLDYEESLEKVWDQVVYTKAYKLVSAFIANQDIQDGIEGFKPEPFLGPSMPSDEDLKLGPPPYTCEKCDKKTFYDLHSFKSHLVSNRHKKRKNPFPRRDLDNKKSIS